MAANFGFDAYDVETHSDPFVFISYKNEDSDRVAVYARYLRDHGVNVWYDNGIHAGSDWESYLMSVIEKPACKAVLLFVSAKVAQSTVIPLETTQARVCGKPTVAIYLEPGLDLEVLLNKAIKVYVAQRQSVNAYTGSEAEVCARVLEAAKGAMSKTASVTSASADALWKNARMFLMNARRSHSEEDTDRARDYLKQMVEQEPSDYRGWQGMAESACLHRPGSLDAALEQLGEGAKYYSYVVAAGADEAASAEYTEAKTWLWGWILDELRRSLAGCADAEDAERFREKAKQFDNRFGHTLPYVKADYERLMNETGQLIERMAEEQPAAEPEAPEEPAEQFEWKVLSGRKVALARYTGQAESVEIPGEVDGRRVTRVESGAFENCARLTSVTVPDSVKKLGKHPFMGCPNLTVYGTGGLFSKARKAARRSGVKYKRLKKSRATPHNSRFRT